MGVPTTLGPPLLTLDNFSVYPNGGAVGSLQYRVGTVSMLRCLGAFMTDLKAMGYTRVRVIGQRISGANPGRSFDLTVGL
jgi:hypothetical protein